MTEIIDTSKRLTSLTIGLGHSVSSTKFVWDDVTITGRNLIRTITMLLNAGSYGCHASEFPKDHLARLEQLGIPYTCFDDRRRGTGDALSWTRLNDSSRQFRVTEMKEATS